MLTISVIPEMGARRFQIKIAPNFVPAAMKRVRCSEMSPAEPFETVYPNEEARGDEVVNKPLNEKKGSSDVINCAKVESSINIVII